MCHHIIGRHDPSGMNVGPLGIITEPRRLVFSDPLWLICGRRGDTHFLPRLYALLNWEKSADVFRILWAYD